jgi:hypothetical protein
MKYGLRFTTSTFLAATACSAIALSGCITSFQYLQTFRPYIPLSDVVVVTMVVSPFWVTVAACAFAIGRGRLTAKTALGFAIIEGAAVGLSIWLSALAEFR